jgi:RNA polymerase sigma factor (TIGR02999 family)
MVVLNIHAKSAAYFPHQALGLSFQSFDSARAERLSCCWARDRAVPMTLSRDSPVTTLLVRWRQGDERALDALIPLVYAELRALAHHYLRRERPDNTLQSTALVHEAYVRLVGQEPPALQNRAHFFGVAARLMREILVEHARAHQAEKRGGGAPRVSLDDAVEVSQPIDVNVLRLDDALKELARIDERQSRIVELRYFAGLSIEETSEVLGVSEATVSRDWTTARAWLYREIAQK